MVLISLPAIYSSIYIIELLILTQVQRRIWDTQYPNNSERVVGCSFLGTSKFRKPDSKDPSIGCICLVFPWKITRTPWKHYRNLVAWISNEAFDFILRSLKGYNYQWQLAILRSISIQTFLTHRNILRWRTHENALLCAPGRLPKSDNHHYAWELPRRSGDLFWPFCDVYRSVLCLLTCFVV